MNKLPVYLQDLDKDTKSAIIVAFQNVYQNKTWQDFAHDLFEDEIANAISDVRKFWANWTSSREGTTTKLIELCNKHGRIDILRIVELKYSLGRNNGENSPLLVDKEYRMILVKLIQNINEKDLPTLKLLSSIEPKYTIQAVADIFQVLETKGQIGPKVGFKQLEELFELMNRADLVEICKEFNNS